MLSEDLVLEAKASAAAFFFRGKASSGDIFLEAKASSRDLHHRPRLAQYSKRVELLPHSMFGLEFGDSPRIPSRRLSDHPSKIQWRSRLLNGLIRQRLRL